MSTILIANVANLFRFVTLTDFDSKHNSSHFLHFISTYYFGYDWIITIMKDSKHVLSTINNKRVVLPFGWEFSFGKNGTCRLPFA